MEQTGSDQIPVAGTTGNFSTTFKLGKQATRTVRLQVNSLRRPSHLQFPPAKTNETSTPNRDSLNDR
jgi:hypothetical protein